MIAKARARFIRISPRKFRQVIRLVKLMPVEEAIQTLKCVKRKAASYAVELLGSAVSNAKRSHQDIPAADLYISRFTADCGPTMKRYHAASMGRAATILKRMSHITVELDAIKRPEQPTAQKRSARAKAAAPARTKQAKPSKKAETGHAHAASAAKAPAVATKPSATAR